MHQPFVITLFVESIHEYTVDANTPEEATSIAEQYFADGEEGTVISESISDSDAFPKFDDLESE